MLLLNGCARFQAARECGQFASVVNDWVARGQNDPTRPPPHSAAQVAREARALADRYDALARSIDGLHVSAADVRPLATRYRALAASASTSLREVAAAVERGDDAAARQRRVQFDDIARAEAPLVADINRVCH